jgi:hypothetical protein
MAVIHHYDFVPALLTSIRNVLPLQESRTGRSPTCPLPSLTVLLALFVHSGTRKAISIQSIRITCIKAVQVSYDCGRRVRNAAWRSHVEDERRESGGANRIDCGPYNLGCQCGKWATNR